MTENMIIDNVVENCESCPECVCIEFCSDKLIRTGQYVKVNFYGKRIFKIIKVEAYDRKKIAVKAVEIGYIKNLLYRKKDIDIFSMLGLTVDIPTEEEISQAKMNASYI